VKDRLDLLEELLVEELIQKIKDGTAHPAHLNVARQYLKEKKDNRFAEQHASAPKLEQLLADMPFPLKMAE
jgi:hypothetical protein